MLAVIKKIGWNCRKLLGISTKWKNPVKNGAGDLKSTKFIKITNISPFFRSFDKYAGIEQATNKFCS